MDVAKAAKTGGVARKTAVAKVRALDAKEAGESGRIHGKGAADVALKSFGEGCGLGGEREIVRGNNHGHGRSILA